MCCDRQLQRQLGCVAEAHLESRAQPQRDLVVRRPSRRHAVGEPGGRDGAKRANGEAGVGSQHAAGNDLRRRSEPEAREAWTGAVGQRGQHTAASGDEPRGCSLARDGDRLLRDDEDSERMRERAIEPDGRDRRHGLDLPLELADIEGDQALSGRGAEGCADVACHGGRSARDDDVADCERRGRSSDRVEPGSDEDERDRERNGATRGGETVELEASAPARTREREDGALRA